MPDVASWLYLVVITRFGTDEFTGNVLFAVFLILTIGLYFGFQSVIESLFDRLFSVFQRKKRVAIANTAAGEEVAFELPDGPRDTMDDSSESAEQVIQENAYYLGDDYPEDYSGGEIVEDDEDAEYVELNGQMIKIGPIDEDVVFVELEHNIKEYSSLQERIELRGEYPYFEDYIGGHSVEEVTDRYLIQRMGKPPAQAYQEGTGTRHLSCTCLSGV